MTSRKIKGQWETKGQSTMANERSTKLKPKRSRKHRQTFKQSGGGKDICNYSQTPCTYSCVIVIIILKVKCKQN